MNKSLVFTPGCDWKIDRRRILFVEYETVTGKPESKRFDLSAETEYVVDGYKTLSFDEISKPESKSHYSIRRVVYFEKECSSIVSFTRGCRQTRLLIPTRIDFDTVIPTKRDDNVEEIQNKLLRNVANSAYGISSRDWADVLADSARYIHMQRSRCSGKTLWLSSATSFADKQPLWNIADYYHDVCEQWLKTPPEPYEFIADDLEDCEKGVPNTKLIDSNALYFQDTTTGEMKPYEGIKLAVCSTREKAEHFCEVLNRNGGRYGDKADIEEYPVDSIPIEDLDIPVWCVGFKGKPLYVSDVRKCDRGGALDINKLNPYRLHDFTNGNTMGGSMYAVDVMAETKEEAIKKASDYLAKYRAEKEGL